MTNVISRLIGRYQQWSFRYNCYEAVHPWTPYCSEGALDIGLTVLVEAFKLYTPLYLGSQFLRRRYHGEDFKESLKSILRSTTFISANAYLAILFFCSSQQLTGKFYYFFAAYLPAFIASFMAIAIERPGRRPALAFYVANVASETIFKAGVARGSWPSINNGQVLIFTISIATLMAMAKRNGFESDPLSTALRVAIGPEEAAKKRSRHRNDITNNQQDQDQNDDHYDQQVFCDNNDKMNNDNHQTEQSTFVALKCLLDRYNKLKQVLFQLVTQRHRLCPHANQSCSHYVLRSMMRSFAIGYMGQFVLRSLTRIPLVVSTRDMSPLLAVAKSRNTLNTGLFLASFCGLFKLTNCVLRWTTDSSNPTNCFIAGIVAGPTMLINPSSTIALYVVWKCIEALFNEAVKLQCVKHDRFLIMSLYALATSQLFYSAVLDPRYIKSSYMSFLDRMSNHRLHHINRSVLDVFGTDASSGYEDFFPDLHPRFMSAPFIESIFIWLLETKFKSLSLR